MYCILLTRSSILFSAVDDFNLKSNFILKSKVKSYEKTMKENTVKIADAGRRRRRSQLGFERYPAF